MAAPSYTEDLTDISLAESTTDGGTWAQIGGAGNIAMGSGPDFAMQGTNCVDAKVSNVNRGMAVPFTAFTPGANEHIFVWLFTSTPGLASSLALGGVTVAVGTSTTAYVQFHVDGGDTFGALGRVGKCYPVRYRTDSTTSPPYRTVTGTPGASPSLVGGQWNIAGTVKGSNVAVDAIRRGTGAYLTGGELISAGDASDDPCTFTGFATQDQTGTNRWGILLNLGGGSFGQQGRFVIGQDNAGTATLARFRDSDKTISFVDTPHALSDFSQIIIDHTSTRVEWTNISLVGLGTTNPGRLVVNANNPTFVWTGGNNANIDTTVLRSNSSLSNVSWRSCGQITQNGASLSDCSISSNTAASAVLSGNPNLISGCTFTSAGTGHAIEITTSGTYAFSANQFSGYAASDGSTGNEAVYNNSGGAVTLNVTDGGGTPTIRNGVGASTTVNNATTYTLTNVQAGTEVTIVRDSDGVVLFHVESSTGGSEQYSYNYTVDTPVTVLLMHLNYEPLDFQDTLRSSAGSVPVNQSTERNYSNPA